MSAISDIRDKELSTWTNAEKCFVELWEQMGFEDMAEEAAADYAAMQARIEKLERVEKIARQISKLFSKAEIIYIDDKEFNVWSIVGDAEKYELEYALKGDK